uniref:DUF3456 domain-containing protein n=1 Tax=Haptolina brevifila TaxID=156173 RepID=A0A7S2N765_9EUKA|mmetsp:Transcript_68750/g.136232  ORF Transcript_68750/g.136232 Transcript_68750/m.136232 type:complete len:206 (+) Transcript_68750:155-772(+)|eukprot:CAMPEP_0174728400 /NCGR_PEP_ID=MMETSP1094-20130205/51666_1 /TAXON_ID=156173 /ORGANISM="Chrysochromulina brevifilum, Strain UTEX LB 985" /LENGTH=205 /DNA_ID=CAMNT_0015930305 /DNA_START=152 /DNA_END=769 /DNA_ORIENTATION=-
MASITLYRTATSLLLLALVAADLAEHMAHLDQDKATCSACNLIAKTLDDVSPLSSKVVKSWKAWSTAERSKGLKKTLQTACRSIANVEVAKSGRPGQYVYFNGLDMKKNGFASTFDDTKTGPEITQVVQTFCELLVSERASIFTAKMEAWMAGKKGRRLVDFRMTTDAQMCSGGVLSVCKESEEKPGNEKSTEDSDDEYEDDKEL